jgi:uncharacterized protein YndB with AHSA1/START domain
MDIHHEMIVHNTPERVYGALTQTEHLSVWLGAPVAGQAEVGAVIAIQFERRTMKLEITVLEAGRRVQWRVLEPMWPMEGIDQAQLVTWTLEPYEVNTLVSFRMEGWPRDDGVYASVSYKWASFMMRLKVYLGDTREIDGFMVRQM